MLFETVAFGNTCEILVKGVGNFFIVIESLIFSVKVILLLVLNLPMKKAYLYFEIFRQQSFHLLFRFSKNVFLVDFSIF